MFTLTETTRQRVERLERLARDPNEHSNLLRLLTYYHRLDRRFRQLPEEIPPQQSWRYVETLMQLIGDHVPRLVMFDSARREAVAGFFRIDR